MIKTRGGRLAPFNMMASSRVSADLPPSPLGGWGGGGNMKADEITQVL